MTGFIFLLKITGEKLKWFEDEHVHNEDIWCICILFFIILLSFRVLMTIQLMEPRVRGVDFSTPDMWYDGRNGSPHVDDSTPAACWSKLLNSSCGGSLCFSLSVCLRQVSVVNIHIVNIHICLISWVPTRFSIVGTTLSIHTTIISSQFISQFISVCLKIVYP